MTNELVFMVNKIKRKVSFLVIMLSAAISALFFVAIPYISCSEHMICAPSTLEGVLSLVKITVFQNSNYLIGHKVCYFIIIWTDIRVWF